MFVFRGMFAYAFSTKHAMVAQAEITVKGLGNMARFDGRDGQGAAFSLDFKRFHMVG
jgi:hypothetical protein